MQGSENTNNVVSLFDARSKAAKKDASKETSNETKSDSTENDEDMTFDQIMNRNMKNLERMRKERNNANKSVLRSYRIKH